MKRPFSKILVVDPGGTPRGWITARDAILYAATDSVVWIPPGATTYIAVGGTNHDGELSTLEIAAIMAIKGPAAAKFASYSTLPRVSRKILFARDRHRCAYCGSTFQESVLTRDHINPRRFGGKNTWANLITACKPCNGRKADRTPEKAGMKLQFQPYVPSKLEVLYLSHPNMENEQREYVENFIKMKSRRHGDKTI
jgi:hypothetical protein